MKAARCSILTIMTMINMMEENLKSLSVLFPRLQVHPIVAQKHTLRKPLF